MNRRQLLVVVIAGVHAVCTSAMAETSKSACPESSSIRQKFDVAAIHRYEGPPVIGGMVGIQVSGPLVTIHMSLRGLINKAYQARFTSGEQGVPNAIFEIRAKMPDGTKALLVPEMLCSLLEDRFKLAAHWGKQAKKVYLLKIAGATKLTRSEGLDASLLGFDAGFTTSNAGAGTISALNGGTIRTRGTADGGSRIGAKGGSLEYLGELLSRLLDRPVMNGTGLHGYFDFTVSVSREDVALGLDPEKAATLRDLPNPKGEHTQSLRESLKALGLKLEAAEQEVDVLVIDRVPGVPTDN